MERQADPTEPSFFVVAKSMSNFWPDADGHRIRSEMQIVFRWSNWVAAGDNLLR